MGFCSYQVKDHIFVLTLDARDGHNYLTLESARDLLVKLREIRLKGEHRRSFKGLITNGAAGGAFTDGVDYEHTPPAVVTELTYLMAEAVHELYNMPFATVAAVTGAARTSLAMALVLAHDEIAAAKDAVFEVPEVRGGRLLPPYFASLLRGRAQYAGMRSSMVLRAKAMAVPDMTNWYMFECQIDGDDDADGVKIGSSVIKGSFAAGDGKAFVTTRKSFYPEAWKAVCVFLAGPLSQTKG